MPTLNPTNSVKALYLLIEEVSKFSLREVIGSLISVVWEFYIITICQRSYVFASVCLFVCLLTELLKNCRSNLCESLWNGWT